MAARIMAHLRFRYFLRHSATARHAMTMMYTIASAHICLSNDFVRDSFLLIRSIAELSPEALKALEDKRSALQGVRDGHFANLLLMTKLVAWGVILEGPELVYEIIAVIKRWRRKKTRDHAPAFVTFIGLVGWILVSVGVAGEFWVDGKVNSDDNGIQTINIELLKDAGTSASAAAKAASDAKGDAGQAKAKSDSAVTSASTALTLAKGARREADSFENKITSADQKATDAETHLADAERQASAALADLNLLKSPRLLTNASQLADALRPFAGTEYTFSLVGEDHDSLNLLKQIDAGLQLAGWKRVKPSAAIGLPIEDFGKDFLVPMGFADGVEVTVESTESIESLRSRISESWPVTLRAAGALKNALTALITPKEHNVQKDLVVKPGSSLTVQIAVGSKVVISNSP